MYCVPDNQGFCDKCGKLIPFAGRKAMCGRSKPHGIGSHLKTILRRFGIRSGFSCNCTEHARELNTWTADEAEKNIGTIVEMLKSEAIKRQMLFIDKLAELVIRRAIANCRSETKRIYARKEASRAAEVRVSD